MKPLGEYRGEPLYHGSLSTEKYRQLLHQNGFEVNPHVEEDVPGFARFAIRRKPNCVISASG